jgi:protein phosphatase
MFSREPTEQTARHSPNGARAAAPRFAVRSEQNGREENEDSFHLFALAPATGEPPVTFLSVADGMGGHEHGAEVSSESLKKISLALFEELVVIPSLNSLEAFPPFGRGAARTFTPENVGHKLLSALDQANAHVRRMVKQEGWSKAGSTVVVAAVNGREVTVANLGDSPLFHFRAAEGRLVQVTEDHTVAGVLMRAGVITPEMARVHEGRSRLEFFLGVETLPRDEPVRHFLAEAGDLLLLCSDGISGALTREQIESVLRETNGDLEEAAERLVTSAQGVGETDNQTLILWQLP